MSANSEEFAASSISHLSDKLQATVDEAEDRIESKVRDMQDTAEDLQKQAYNAGVKLREWASTFWEQAEESRHKIEDNIRQRPFTSSLALFAAGIITARVIFRK